MSDLILDANESAFFSRELTAVENETYDIQYPELKARSIIPVNSSVNAGAETITYRSFDQIGEAKVISNAATDLPRVDVLGTEYSRPVKTVGDAFGYSVVEIKNANMAGRALSTDRAAAARKAIEYKLDDIAALGSAVDGIATGFLNDANVTISATGGAWGSATPATIIADFTAALTRINDASKGVEMANTVVLPDAKYSQIATTPRSATSDSTILAYILANFPTITEIIPWYKAKTAGVSAVNRMVVYNRNPSKLKQHITDEYQQLAPQAKGLEMIVNCMARTAGTTIYYPRSMDYTDGI